MAILKSTLKGQTRNALSAAIGRITAIGLHAWILARDRTPIFGKVATSRRARIVLQPYTRAYSIKKTILGIVSAPILIISCLMYGFFFGLTAPTLTVAFVVPIFVITALIIWALPHQSKAPTFLIEFLYPFFFVALILWPNYVGISLHGLPWITIIRLIGLPLVILFLINLSVSISFRRRVFETITSIKLLWYFFVGFIFIQIVTIVTSRSPGASAQLVFNQQIYWTAIFAIGCAIFRDTRQIEKYMALLCILAVPIVLISFPESAEKHVLWMNKIPKILTIPDPSVKVILTPTFRAGTNFFRVRTTFSTSLEQAEYLSLLTPFLLYFGFSSKSVLFRIFSFALIPAIFIAIRLTDSRLGVVGMLVSILLYGVLWSIVRWRAHPRDLIAAATVYLYPIVFVTAIGVVLTSHRLRAMALGGDAQASSTAARESQLAMAIKGFKKAPWGWGAGQSGDAIGYPPGQFVAIDNHFIVLLLEYGALGIIAWYGIFIVAIVQAARHSMSAQYAGRLEARLLAPLAIELTAFIIIKWVHGGNYTHPIDFMILGMVSALIYNLHHGSPLVRPTPSRAGLRTEMAVNELPSYALVGHRQAFD